MRAFFKLEFWYLLICYRFYVGDYSKRKEIIMEKRGKLAAVLLILVLGLLVAGPNAVANPAKPEWTLRFANVVPETAFATQNSWFPWMDAVYARTNGRVKIDYYGGETLAKGVDNWEAVKSGIADLAWLVYGYFPGQFPLNDVIGLPMIGPRFSKHVSGIQWRIYQKFPQLQNEFKGVKVLGFASSGPYILYTNPKAGPIKKLEDFKGKKIRFLAGWPTEFAKKAGANPVLISIAEIYQALQRGIVDGVTHGYETFAIWKYSETCKYINTEPLYWGGTALIMNQDKWDSMPKDVQDAMWSECGLRLSHNIGYRYFDASYAEYLMEKKRKEKEGYEYVIYNPSEENLKEWRDKAVKPVWDEWKSVAAKAGLDGQAVLDEIQRLYKAYEAGTIK
jgi:TRAP-type C4-dicarboxylate transport system substrate-binding protein